MSAIYAITDENNVPALNAVFEALLRGPVFSARLTTDNPSTPASPTTHRHMYDASANARDFADYVAAKEGLALPPDINGDPVAWGEGGLPTEVSAYAAFATLQLWANDSTREPSDFADEQRIGLGLNVWSPL